MEQVELARHARACGARWLILQPPPVTGVSESALIRYFGEALAEIDLPVGLQIAPQYLGSGLSAAGALTMGERFPQLKILKIETSGYGAAVLAQEVGHRFAIFNGQDGVDLVDTLRGGGAGCIPGAEFADVLARIYDGLVGADEAGKAAAEATYLKLAPALSFLMASMDRFLVYGKRVMCGRLGLPPENTHVRSPAGLIDAQGEAIIAHWSRSFGKFGSER
jgi:4-hydroxy-tetrahydrodipicolinate synthase